MTKKELRAARRGMNFAAGDVERELAELERLQKTGKKPNSEVVTITVGCTTFFSIVCC